MLHIANKSENIIIPPLIYLYDNLCMTYNAISEIVDTSLNAITFNVCRYCWSRLVKKPKTHSYSQYIFAIEVNQMIIKMKNIIFLNNIYFFFFKNSNYLYM